MPLRVVRLGTPRHSGEGLRLGTVRRPPRGVKKEDYSRRDYFDIWLPELAPGAPLVKYALSQPLTFDAGQFESPIPDIGRRVNVMLRGKGYAVAYRESAVGHNYTAWRDRLADAYTALWAK